MMSWNQLGFQDFGTPLGSLVAQFHDSVLLVLAGILSLVSMCMWLLPRSNMNTRSAADSDALEVAWTVLPACVLMALGYPSLVLLYSFDALESTSNTSSLKVVGHQWYWSYGISGVQSPEGEAPDPDDSSTLRAPSQGLELLDCSQEVLLPVNTSTKVHVTSNDVLHSWTVPALSVKLDAIPGRLNSSSFLATLPGKFYGQCSELCGAGHSYMPTVVLFY